MDHRHDFAIAQAGTVNNTWLNASNTVFGWAAKHKHIPRNPFADVNVTVPKRTKLRETQAFYPEEQRVILKAALGTAIPLAGRCGAALGAVALRL